VSCKSLSTGFYQDASCWLRYFQEHWGTLNKHDHKAFKSRCSLAVTEAVQQKKEVLAREFKQYSTHRKSICTWYWWFQQVALINSPLPLAKVGRRWAISFFHSTKLHIWGHWDRSADCNWSLAAMFASSEGSHGGSGFLTLHLHELCLFHDHTAV
jgi:hypothetical protein